MNTKRIQLEMPVEKVVELESLMQEYGVGTKKEFFNISINLLKWALKEKKEGRTIGSIDEKSEKYKEVILPI